MEKVFRKFISFIVAVSLVAVCFTSVYAADETSTSKDESWAFYVYLVDNDKTTSYNNELIKEMGYVYFPRNIKVVSETSWGSSFDSFMRYCKNNADADHKILIIAGEGEGMYGIKKDNYSYFKLSDIENGLASSYTFDEKNPAFDMTIMSTSLMGNIEMGKILNGYSKYLVAPETLYYEGEGFYTKWFGDFVRNSKKDLIELGKSIVDAYMNMVEGEMRGTGTILSTNMSFIDVNKLAKAYDRYEIYAKNVLKRLSKDKTIISTIGEKAKRTITTADSIGTDFYFNMVDFVDLMDNIGKVLPIEALNAKNEAARSILYKRDVGLVKNMSGVGAYFPRSTFAGHDELLKEYTNKISKNTYINALYDYKMNGKLNEEETSVLKKELKIKIDDISFLPLQKFADINPKLQGNLNFTYTLPKEMKGLSQDVYVSIYKRENDKFILYNNDIYNKFDNKRNINVLFDAKWDQINDIPLSVNLLTTTNDYKTYYSDICFNDNSSKIVIAYESKGSLLKLAGIGEELPYTRIFGNVITPIKDGEAMGIYDRTADLNTNSVTYVMEKPFRYNSNYKVENKILPDGEYTMNVVLEDIRGIRYVGSNILFNIRDGALYQLISEKDLFAKN